MTIQYLGHVQSPAGISPDPENIAVIMSWQTLKSKKEMKQFLGVLSFYQRFIPEFTACCHWLHLLLPEKTPWVWTVDHQQDFLDLRSTLVNYPILGYFDSELQTHL